MNEKKQNRTRILQVRVSEKEYKQISDGFSGSTCRKLSEFARKKLLDKPVRVYTRNQSLDEFMSEMILLRRELNALANNFNQAVKKLNAMQHFLEIKIWLRYYEIEHQLLLKKVGEIKDKMAQISDQWLQS